MHVDVQPSNRIADVQLRPTDALTFMSGPLRATCSRPHMAWVASSFWDALIVRILVGNLRDLQPAVQLASRERT